MEDKAFEFLSCIAEANMKELVGEIGLIVKNENKEQDIFKVARTMDLIHGNTTYRVILSIEKMEASKGIRVINYDSSM